MYMTAKRQRQFAVIGLGVFGTKLVKELSEQGASVIAIDKDISKINKIQDIASVSIQLDSIDQEALEKSGIKEMDVVVVGIGRNMEASILTTKILKEIGVKEIIARALNSLHAKILKAVGADRVIFPEEDTAQNLARSILIPGIKEYIKLKGPWDLSEIQIGPLNKFIGKKLESLEARKKYQVNILMITRIKNMKKTEKIKETEEIIEKEEGIVEFPSMDYILKEGDILVVCGKAENLEKFQKACEGFAY